VQIGAEGAKGVHVIRHHGGQSMRKQADWAFSLKGFWRATDTAG
jgi:hypothetical protein